MLHIAIGGDHAGVEYKAYISEKLTALGYIVKDFGPNETTSVDYPDHAHPLATSVSTGENTFGILICGSGNGVAMTANKHQKVRAALCWTPEIAKLARQHNDANIIALPARFMSVEEAWKAVEVFVTEPFEGGRHQNRVNKIRCD
jgi:ribose 5-phosphate isomerase B